jgi:hypothetical protein
MRKRNIPAKIPGTRTIGEENLMHKIIEPEKTAGEHP